MCDAEAHKNIDIQGRKINLDSKVCMSKIRENKEFILLLNDVLITYVEKLQDFIDCNYYSQDFAFPFIFKYEKEF